jgi:transcriptional regulator with XRE-family HTH domain
VSRDHPGVDDLSVGRALRLLRQRRGMTQAQVGRAAGVSQPTVSLIERGHLGATTLRTLRRVFAAVDASVDLYISWRGGALDRLTDEAHAQLVLRRATTLRDAGWMVVIEATYSVYGERGSIDLFAARAQDRAVIVEEVKSDVTSLEQLGRKSDEKVRLVRSRLCRERFGFDPVAVGRVLVLPDTTTARRRVGRLAPALDVMFPRRTRDVASWVRHPSGDLAGIVFVPDISGRGGRRDRRGRQRVRSARSGPRERAGRSA